MNPLNISSKPNFLAVGSLEIVSEKTQLFKLKFFFDSSLSREEVDFRLICDDFDYKFSFEEKPEYFIDDW